MCSGHGTCVDTVTADLYSSFCPPRDSPSCSPVEKFCDSVRFLREKPYTFEPDFRYDWPAQIFTRICQCDDNFSGYDCSRCKPGLTGDDCQQVKAPVVRKNFLDLNPNEQKVILEAFVKAKYNMSNFTVPIVEKPQNESSFKQLSLYDVFATFHYYSVRYDNDTYFKHHQLQMPNERIPDFGHEGPTFLTWHRAYLLYFEREMQYMLNDLTFALPYWDWTEPNAIRIFNTTLFGVDDCMIDGSTSRNRITSKYFRNWTPVCTNFKNLTAALNMCDPYVNDIPECGGKSHIDRCVNGTEDEQQCRAGGKLPTQNDVNLALMQSEYDRCNYNNKNETNGFRNSLEGFYDFDYNGDKYNCGNETKVFANLHNRVHLFIGGLMQDVPTSSNDPIFWLHHCNIDRIYEQWLNSEASNTNYKPDSQVEYGVQFGHNINDNLGLLFPPITNREANNRAITFGYEYQQPLEMSDNNNNNNDDSSINDNSNNNSNDNSNNNDDSNNNDNSNSNDNSNNNDNGNSNNDNNNDNNSNNNNNNNIGNNNREGGNSGSNSGAASTTWSYANFISILLVKVMLDW